MVEVTVLVKIQREHGNRLTIFRTTAEILINLQQTQFKYVRHYFV